jgi:hypothetical protein
LRGPGFSGPLIFWGEARERNSLGASSEVLDVAIALIEFVDADLAAQCIAVNAEQAGGAGLIAVRAIQGALDESLLEFIHGFVE